MRLKRRPPAGGGPTINTVSSANPNPDQSTGRNAHVLFILLAHTYCFLYTVQSKMWKIELITRLFLFILAVVFLILSLHLLTDPASALAPHGINITGQPNSALAEIRAYYCGTMFVIAMILIRGASWKSSQSQRRDSLTVTFTLMIGFAAARMYAYIVDGPPELRYSYVLWAVEWIVAVTALIILGQQTSEISSAKTNN